MSAASAGSSDRKSLDSPFPPASSSERGRCRIVATTTAGLTTSLGLEWWGPTERPFAAFGFSRLFDPRQRPFSLPALQIPCNRSQLVESPSPCPSQTRVGRYGSLAGARLVH